MSFRAISLVFLGIIFSVPLRASSVVRQDWRQFRESPDTLKIYVSSSVGNNDYDGLYPDPIPGTNHGPKKNLRPAYDLMRDGYPDWLLLRRGDTWRESISGDIKNGRSATEPMLIGAYGNGERPLLLTGAYSGISLQNSNLAITNLHLVGDGNTGAGDVMYGIAFSAMSGPKHVTIQDNKIERYTVNISVTWVGERPEDFFINEIL